MKDGLVGFFVLRLFLKSGCHKILTETEIKVLEKRLGFVPLQRTFNEIELRKGLNEEERDPSDIFVMKFLKRLGKHLHFDLSQVGFPLRVMLV